MVVETLPPNNLLLLKTIKGTVAWGHKTDFWVVYFLLVLQEPNKKEHLYIYQRHFKQKINQSLLSLTEVEGCAWLCCS